MFATALTILMLERAAELEMALLIDATKLVTVPAADEPVLKKYTLPSTSLLGIGSPEAMKRNVELP